MKCRSCETEVDFKTMGGKVGTFNGRPVAFCQWCCMCFDDYLKKVRA